MRPNRVAWVALSHNIRDYFIRTFCIATDVRHVTPMRPPGVCYHLSCVFLILQWYFIALLFTMNHNPEDTMTGLLLPRPNWFEVDHSIAEPPGVAATLMLRAPKWFHRRYTIMLHNVLANIPEDWKVQIFVNQEWLEKDVLPLHPGLQTMYQQSHESSWTVGRITWTPLPTNMVQQKPKQIFKSTWFWESMLAENILLFGGNGALCANSQASLNDFRAWDYVGTPWTLHHQKGGDGSTHSFRHRSAMLSILQTYPLDNGPDYQFFVKHLLERDYKVANKETTMAFGGISEWDRAPFLLSGTQAKLNWTQRENILSVCPEIKVIFPSMHEPACFGAHPNGTKCKESICALQDQIPSQGCWRMTQVKNMAISTGQQIWSVLWSRRTTKWKAIFPLRWKQWYGYAMCRTIETIPICYNTVWFCNHPFACFLVSMERELQLRSRLRHNFLHLAYSECIKFELSIQFYTSGQPAYFFPGWCRHNMVAQRVNRSMCWLYMVHAGSLQVYWIMIWMCFTNMCSTRLVVFKLHN